MVKMGRGKGQQCIQVVASPQQERICYGVRAATGGPRGGRVFSDLAA
jgi:hypothetical protein